FLHNRRSKFAYEARVRVEKVPAFPPAAARPHQRSAGPLSVRACAFFSTFKRNFHLFNVILAV
ncbi:hypothetical protein K8353_45830, partial [Burkholderia contaminans]|nr:hypothetical protein [Burkholderia contaminans]